MLISHQINRCQQIAAASSPLYTPQAYLGHVLSQCHGELACQ